MSGSFHLLDFVAIFVYLVVVIYLGKVASKGASGEEGYFLAGRKLGKAYQFFLNFGNATDANGAVSTSSIVYRQGVAGVWYSFQTVFMNPYYWFMNMWFRRVRLTTTADLFEDRLGSRKLAGFYAIFQVFATVVLTIGFGNLVAYKISASLLVKPETSWTAEERLSVEGYRELKTYEAQLRGGSFAVDQQARLDILREQEKRGELRSYISYIDEGVAKWAFYIGYTIVIGVYIVMGGLAATALNEAFQGILIVVFSCMLIPSGLAAIGGWSGLGERVDAAKFELLSASGAADVTGWTLMGILLVSLIQIHGIIGNMSVSGSAKNEFAARFGAVSGTYAKRVMIILWAFCGLIGIALYSGEGALADPDAVWGTMSRQLLGPGFLGLMLAGILAANMSTVAAQAMAASALFARNVFPFFTKRGSVGDNVKIGRYAIVVILAVGVIAATNMNNVFSVIQELITVNVPFGAAVVLIFFWRRLTAPAVWTAVIVCAIVNIAGPLLVQQVAPLTRHPALVRQVEAANGRTEAVFFERVVRDRPDDPSSPVYGTGRFHTELFILDSLGLDVGSLGPANRKAARFFFDGFLPFFLLIVVSLFTRAPDKRVVDLFYGKMKTPVGATPTLEAEGIEETRRNPHRFDDKKLFRSSAWEFTKWDRVDTIGFFACCLVSGGLIALFWGLLRLASPA